MSYSIENLLGIDYNILIFIFICGKYEWIFKWWFEMHEYDSRERCFGWFCGCTICGECMPLKILVGICVYVVWNDYKLEKKSRIYYHFIYHSSGVYWHSWISQGKHLVKMYNQRVMNYSRRCEYTFWYSKCNLLR